MTLVDPWGLWVAVLLPFLAVGAGVAGGIVVDSWLGMREEIRAANRGDRLSG